MKSIRTILLIAASISFMIVLGGGVYEHLAVVPQWKQAPPASLTMFQGEYGLDPGNFWMLIHPVSIVLLVAALATNWRTARRKYIGITLLVYAIIIAVTATYFVPELVSIIRTTYQDIKDSSLVARANLWEKLSLLRLVIILAVAGTLLFSLTKGNEEAVQHSRI